MAFPFEKRVANSSNGQQAAVANGQLVGQLAIEQAINAVRQQAQDQRPVRTQRAYNAKQQEFMSWAQEHCRTR